MAFQPLQWLASLQESLSDSNPRPGLHPIPNTKPLTLLGAILPPIIYYLALLLLAPPPPPAVDSLPVKILRNCLALVAGVLFFRLPLVYHVPQSIGLTYQLGLVGLYGGCRVLDAFFISPYLFGHIPRRVKYHHIPREDSSEPMAEAKDKEWSNGGVIDPFHHTGDSQEEISRDSGNDDVSRFKKSAPALAIRSGSAVRSALRRSFSGPDPVPVLETAITESGWPTTLLDRAAWALELELSMRGIGFTWTTADVRHTRKTWLPTVHNRVHSIVVHVTPVLLVSWAVIRTVYVRYLMLTRDAPWDMYSAYDLFDHRLPMALQLLLTVALGAFLMAAFSFGHSLFAIMLNPLAPNPLAFFPPLYTTRPWQITSVRKFWSFGWHRLFARLFLVYGVWPGEWLERKLLGKGPDQPADVGKVIGAFLVSALVHTFSVRGVLAGDWRMATGEAKFFAWNSVAVVLEGIVIMVVGKARKRKGSPVQKWYDPVVGRVWWIAVLLWTGRNFARGWVKSGLVREMALL
ncbi:uncharacterized protein Z519_03052 [Cladophialophora bantiana CBS 173.52]|uniref:Wax synthase domain-containing protein n=1 Tax=Cladophialophora bantiana (strain ATCC 10958 / CBS 173.52 / CDC B-1940 / NIH 8579) TaxID=1442370 RepID=A0A0D2F1E1_CLAB1|nr:uncharacterized protein Z519_03052 [Cladophialophora bantiana CBS 173.52]KIW95986.1 hypothetical protein Z519_03052 [Cladophialophora bantiana CBS 173.52]